MERNLLITVINILTTCYDRHIYDLDIITLKSGEYNIISRNLGEGLMLIFATENDNQDEAKRIAKNLYLKVKALLPA